MIKVEPSAQSLGFANRPVLATRSLVGEGDDIVEPLMIAFVLMVGWVLVERVAQGTLAKGNQLIETCILYCAYPPFGEGVEVGRLWREFEWFHASGAEDGSEILGEFGIAVMEQEAGIGHGPVCDGQVAGDLF